MSIMAMSRSRASTTINNNTVLGILESRSVGNLFCGEPAHIARVSFNALPIKVDPLGTPNCKLLSGTLHRCCYDRLYVMDTYTRVL